MGNSIVDSERFNAAKQLDKEGGERCKSRAALGAAAAATGEKLLISETNNRIRDSKFAIAELESVCLADLVMALRKDLSGR